MTILLVALGAAVLGAVLAAWLVVRRTRRDVEAYARALRAGGDASTAGIPGGEALAAAVSGAGRATGEQLARLREEREVREQILAAMNEGVVLAEGEAVVYANDAARALFAQPDLRVVPPVVQIPAAGAVVQDVTLHHPSRRDLRLATARADDRRIVIVVQDVTEAKRDERVRRDFVANASHELKTPISAILATAETLRSAVEDDPAAAARFAERLVADARRMAELVADLLDLARLDEAAEQEAVVDVARVVEDALAAAAPRCAAGELNLKTEFDRGLTVRGSASELRMLADNLLDNAIRYTNRGGTIAVSCRRRDGHVEIEFADTGEGIPVKDLPRVFERFYRGDPARARATGGTGLGLAIVRHVAETHGGSVRVESQLGAGSSFVVTLPVVAR